MRFRMIDQICAWEERKSIRGIKAVTFEEYDLKTRFGDPAHLPETLLVESILQLANWLIVLSTDFKTMGLLVGMQRIEFEEQARPGQAVELQTTVRRFTDEGIAFDGKALVDGQVIGRGRGGLALPVPLGDYHDPEDLRVLYSEISRPRRSS